jgi:hypothetical protein
MSKSVTINDGVATVSEGGARSTVKDGVQKLHHQGVRQGSVDRISSKDGVSTHDKGRTVVVQSPTRSGLPDHWGTVQNPQGQICGNLSEVTDNHSIEIDGKRATVKTWEMMGRLARNERGELIMIDAPAPEDAPVPLSQTESLKTNQNTTEINELNSRVGEGVTNAFINHMVTAVIDGTSAQSAVSDYAQAVGESEQRVHSFAEQYLSSLLNSGIDYAVRASQGTITSADIEEHLPKLSTGYQKSLLLGLHLNNLASAYELIDVVRQKKIL